LTDGFSELKGKFYYLSLQPEQSKNLKGKFYYLSLQPIQSAILLGKFEVKHSSSANLKGKINIRHSNSKNLLIWLSIRHSDVTPTLLGKFVVKHTPVELYEVKGKLFIPQDDWISQGLPTDALVSLSVIS